MRSGKYNAYLSIAVFIAGAHPRQRSWYEFMVPVLEAEEKARLEDAHSPNQAITLTDPN